MSYIEDLIMLSRKPLKIKCWIIANSVHSDQTAPTEANCHAVIQYGQGNL